MPQTSPFPPLDIPQTDLLSYLFPPNKEPSDTPIWLDSGNPENNLSPRQLLNWVKRLAVGLDGLGIAEGEPVVIFTPNQIFIPVAYLGIVGSRRVFSGINPNYTTSGKYALFFCRKNYELMNGIYEEAAYQLRDTGARALFVYPSLAQVAVQAANEAGLPLDRVFLFSDQPNDSVHGIQDWKCMLGSPEEADRWTWKPMTPSESTSTLATLNYSSGTTGRPKGVCITHSNLIANVEQNAFARFHLRKDRPQERWLGVLPLYHAYGQLYTVLMCVRLHVPVYVMRQFHYEDFLRCIERYKITHLQVAPPMLVMLSKRPETANYNLSSVTDVLCGAAPLSKELQNDVSSRFDVQISQGWGMTETTTGALLVPGGIKDE
jgi:acyl-CoA synthetase (AMP-forming)/AMP-acid ligase II